MNTGQAVVELMEEYFAKRRESGLDSRYFQGKLEVLGKSEGEIHEILMELDNDWQKEMVFDAERKNLPWMLISGFFVVTVCFFMAVWGGQKNFLNNSMNILWAGGMATGLLGILKAISVRKKAVRRAERRRMKYKMYT